MEANTGEYHSKELAFENISHIGLLHCKLVPVQYREYEYGLLIEYKFNNLIIKIMLYNILTILWTALGFAEVFQ